MTARSVSLSAALVAALSATSSTYAHDAQAQSWMIGGDFGVTSGTEVGDPGSGGTVFRRARSRVQAGMTLRNSEDREQGVGLILFGEVEPHTSFGGEARYARWLGERMYAFAGVTGVFAPHWLLGAVGGAQFQIPFGRVGLYIEPSISALPFGSDLGNDHPIFWGLISIGIHLDISRPLPPPGDAK